MLLIDERTFPGCHVWARPVGVLRMADEKGVDFKVLCVALADPLYRHVDALRQVSPHKLLEIEQFFQTYKNLEDKSVEIDGWAGVAETLEILRTDRQRWLDEQAAAGRRGGEAGARLSRDGEPGSSVIEVAGREVRITNPGKVYWAGPGHTKLDLVRYYLAVADGALRGRRRPAHGPQALRQRCRGRLLLPEARPRLAARLDRDRRAGRSPPGRTAEEVVAARRGLAGLGRQPRLPRPQPAPRPRRGPRPSRRAARRPRPGARAWPGRRCARSRSWPARRSRRSAWSGWPKTSGSRGIHVNVRIEPRWTYDEVRRAALALARDVERRAPTLATSKWWKEERHGVFLDYNQNAKDRTVASAYSVRPTPDARVSMPLDWDEVPDVEAGRLHARHRARARRRAGRPWRRHRRRRPARSRRCSSSPRATKPRVWATRRGRRTTASRRASRRASSPRSAAATASPATAPSPVTRRGDGAARSRSSRSRERRSKEDAMAGLERWKARHPEAAAHLEPADVLVDAMRGRSTTWTRIRVNLEHVPEDSASAAGAARPRLRPLGRSGGQTRPDRSAPR